MSTPRPNFTGINHLKLAASGIAETRLFYCNILNFTQHTHWNHYTGSGELFAIMLKVEYLVPPTSTTASPSTSTEGADQTTPTLCEIRYHEAQARVQEGWDPIIFSVETKADLETAGDWFEVKGEGCSKVFTVLKGWVVGVLDPDGKVVKVYCEEQHEWTTEFDKDDFWSR